MPLVGRGVELKDGCFGGRTLRLREDDLEVEIIERMRAAIETRVHHVVEVHGRSRAGATRRWRMIVGGAVWIDEVRRNVGTSPKAEMKLEAEFDVLIVEVDHVVGGQRITAATPPRIARM